jgi:hypothetical protein
MRNLNNIEQPINLSFMEMLCGKKLVQTSNVLHGVHQSFEVMKKAYSVQKYFLV